MCGADAQAHARTHVWLLARLAGVGDSTPSSQPPREEALGLAIHASAVLLPPAGAGFCVPGGLVNEGETLMEAAKRECWEEAGGDPMLRPGTPDSPAMVGGTPSPLLLLVC